MTSRSLEPDDHAVRHEPDWLGTHRFMRDMGILADLAGTRGHRRVYHGKGLGR